MITTMNSREFNQDIGKAKRCALEGPVFISNRKRPEYVLMTIQDYEKLSGKSKTIGELLAMPESADVDFEIEREKGTFRTVDFD